MTDLEYEALVARLKKLVEHWRQPLGLNWWRLSLNYERNGLSQTDGEGWRSLMKVSAKWPYLAAELSFSMPDLLGLSDEELERHFVHECCHILVNEMRNRSENDGQDHEERVCETLTNAFLWVREAALRSTTEAKDGEQDA